jgi:phosphoenolpyruvate synthase/pyruvate phosphate dikinase
LIQRSVPVEKSGVLVSVNLVTGNPAYLTATASEGVGGVVGGEASEALLLPVDGDQPILLDQYKAPTRSQLKMTGEGGFEKVLPSGAERVLLDPEIAALKDLVQTLRERFEPPRDEAGRALPWDVEFGFLDGALWLFQIRPLSSDSPTAQLAGLAAMDRAVLDRADRPVRLDAPLRARP